jgi:hypothetical protein
MQELAGSIEDPILRKALRPVSGIARALLRNVCGLPLIVFV